MSNIHYVIEAEDMELRNYNVVDGNRADGGQLVKASGRDVSLKSDFGGDSGTYDLTIRAQDESDGESLVRVYVDGEVVGEFRLDNNNNGLGSNNGSFSDF